jgi:hypothetical protein
MAGIIREPDLSSIQGGKGKGVSGYAGHCRLGSGRLGAESTYQGGQH